MFSVLMKIRAFRATEMRDRGVLVLMALMLFFFIVYDGMMEFILPLIIDEKGLSGTMVGLIIGLSSVAGGLFDIAVCRLMPQSSFRRIFLLVFLLATLFPVLLLASTGISLFLVAVAVWGLFFDLYRIGTYDFVSRRKNEKEHAGSFGFLEIFISLGFLIAPLIVGFLMKDVVGVAPFVAAYIFLGISVLLYLVLLLVTKRDPQYVELKSRRPLPLLREIRVWKALGHKIFPVLCVSFLISLYDSAYWTVGPLLAENLHFGEFNGIFMAVHTLPALFGGWLVGYITLRYGQKRTAVVTLLLASLVQCAFLFVQSEYLLILTTFIIAFFITLSAPAISGAYADYIAEARKISTEIEAMEDFLYNSGYIIGPICAGFLSDIVGYQKALGFLGLFGVVLMIVVWHIVPKKINVAAVVKREIA